VLATTDPTKSQEYQALVQERAELREDLRSAEKKASLARDERDEIRADYNDRSAALTKREADVKAREDAVKSVEERIEATSIDTGIWTVGVDVEPGTYRTSQPLNGYCYWAITRTGSNNSDIIDNDGPTGGFPTVTLSAGQDFENSGCGTFVKQ